MIDLYADLKYEIDCENKLEYAKMLNGQTVSAFETLTVTNGTPYYSTDSKALYVVGSNPTVKDVNGKFLNAIKISPTLRKFMPDSVT